MEKYLAEFLGTFALVFCGTGAIVVNEVSNGAITHVGIAVCFGLVVTVMIYALGDISGAHLNPAVTLAFVLAKRLQSRHILPYIAAQTGGAILASFTIHCLFPLHPSLGTTTPVGTATQSFILETILGFLLMLVILNMTPDHSEKKMFAGLAIGLTVMLEAMFAGPVSGASMNPARSVGPAFISGRFDDLWIYIIAPVTGAGISVPAFNLLRPLKKDRHEKNISALHRQQLP